MDTRLHMFLIPVFVLASLPFHYARAPNPELENTTLKQHRQFNRLSNWANPIGNEPTNDENDELENRSSNTNLLKVLEEWLKSRQPSEVDDSSYTLHYDSGRELDSSLPIGIQNVMDGTPVRAPRSKNRAEKLPSFQSLCLSRRETVALNLDPDFEYRPDHYEEVTCARPAYIIENNLQPAVCSQVGFSCIQLNRTLFLTRRARGESCWVSETRFVPAGCECMWPKHHLGDIMAHH